MTEIVALTALIPTGILAVLLIRANRQVERVFETAWKVNEENRDAAAKERERLIALVQRPDLSPTIVADGFEPSEEPMYIGMDDDEAHDKYLEQRAAGEVR